MHDLRRQALESHKTVSRKARSKQSTPSSSRLNSPASSSRAASRSRGHSRQGSDDEENGELSDETSFRYVSTPCDELCTSANPYRSVGSIDEMLSGDGIEKSTEAWTAELEARIEEILIRKNSTVQGREKCYKTYVHLLTAQYAEEELRGKEAELVVAFLKSLKEEKSEKETILALKGKQCPKFRYVFPC